MQKQQKSSSTVLQSLEKNTFVAWYNVLLSCISLELNASSKLNLAQDLIGRPKHVTVGQNNK